MSHNGVGGFCAGFWTLYLTVNLESFCWQRVSNGWMSSLKCIAQIFLGGFHEEIPGGSLQDWVLQYGSYNTHTNETILKELHWAGKHSLVLMIFSMIWNKTLKMLQWFFCKFLHGFLLKFSFSFERIYLASFPLIQTAVKQCFSRKILK